MQDNAIFIKILCYRNNMSKNGQKKCAQALELINEAVFIFFLHFSTLSLRVFYVFAVQFQCYLNQVKLIHEFSVLEKGIKLAALLVDNQVDTKR